MSKRSLPLLRRTGSAAYRFSLRASCRSLAVAVGLSLPLAHATSGGTGTAADPYIITASDTDLSANDSYYTFTGTMLTYSSALYMSQSAGTNVHLVLTTKGSSVSASSLGFAYGAGTSDFVEIANGVTLWVLPGTFSFGFAGRADVSLHDGGYLYCNGGTNFVGYGSTAEGNVSVFSSSSLTSSGPLTIGYNSGAKGTITVDGSTSQMVCSGLLDVGYYAGATGTINLQNGGKLYTSSSVYCGSAGSGAIAMSDAAQWTNTASSIGIGYSTGATGAVSLTGSGTLLKSTGIIRVGVSGTGTLSISAGALVAAGAASKLSVGSGGVIQLNGGYLAIRSITRLSVSSLLASYNIDVYSGGGYVDGAITNLATKYFDGSHPWSSDPLYATYGSSVDLTGYTLVYAQDSSAPTVTSPTSASVTSATATLGGNVTSDGGQTVTARGVVYAQTATNSNPQLGGTGVTTATGTGTTGLFTVGVTGLAASTSYTYAAYATNAVDTTYSATGTFTTTTPIVSFPITENFDGKTTSDLTTNHWVIGGNAVATSNHLQLTSAANSQKGSAIYNLPFSSTLGVNVQFDYYMGGGTGADGLSFFLLDGNQTAPTPGGIGGALGYGYNDTTTAGASQAYLGVGLDLWGNYASTAFYNATTGGLGLSTYPNLISLRGPATATNSNATNGEYKFVTGSDVSYSVVGNKKVNLTIMPSGTITMRISADGGSTWMTIYNGFNFAATSAFSGYSYTYNSTSNPMPATFLLGFAASTGGATNEHDIDNLLIRKPIDLATAFAASPSGTKKVGDSVSYTFTVTNNGPTEDDGVSVSCPVPAAITGVSWSYTVSGTATTGSGSTNTINPTFALPANAVATFTVTGTIGSAGVGSTLTHTVTATPSNAFGDMNPANDSATVTTAVQDKPTVNSTLTASGTYGSPFASYTITGTNSPTSFGATGLPSGLVLDTATGVISGTPNASGSFSVSLTATNSGGTSAAAILTLTIAKVTLTPSVTVSDKPYDGNLTGTIASRSVTGVLGSDDVSLTGGTATFDTKTKGTGHTATVSGLSLAGTKAGNYQLSSTTATATASILAKSLTVTGITAANRAYNGTTVATLTTTGATLVGVVSGDTVTLVTSGAVGTFTSSAPGTQTVTITGLTLTGGDAANYTLTPPTTTAAISSGTATIALSNLNQVYSGTAKTVTATTTPAGLTVLVTYNGTVAPTDAGTYTLTARIADSNYTGGASGTLTIAKADQTISFALPSSGTTATLSATASSGLPVTFSIVGGSGVISGSTLTVSGGTVTVRATQAGNNNYNAASVDRTISGGAKLAQSISFAAPASHKTTDASFALSATASSGLPVSFTIVSGPAMLSGNTVTLTGVAGTVVVRASQAGNSSYDPAIDVTQSFTVTAVGAQVYFGTTQNQDTVAVNLATDGASGTLLVYLNATGEAYVVRFTVNPDGTFSTALSPLSIDLGQTPVMAAAATTRTFTGTVSAGGISGMISGSIAFSAQQQPASGPSAPIAGYYRAPSTNTADGTAYSIVGTQNNVFVLAATKTVTTAGSGTVTANNTFTVAGTQSATIAGAIDSSNATVTGSIAVTGQPTTVFAGTNNATLRTDRLINLSSRARISADGSGNLITGFVIGGTSAKRVLLRAGGPSLSKFNITEALADPKLRLYNGDGVVIAENDDWSGADVAAAITQVGAFGFTAGSKDAALLVTLNPGSYTMHVLAGSGAGVAIAEIYDASTNPQADYQRMVNISSRGIVGTGDAVLIGGFVVTGNSPKKLLIRGTGPALTAFGVPSVLSDPQLKLYDSAGTVVAQNDNWGTGTPLTMAQVAATAAQVTAANTATGAFDLKTGSTDSAIIITLAPGSYTAQVSGVSGVTGAALVEVYEIPE